MTHEDFNVKVLGERLIMSPLKPSFHPEGMKFGFIENHDRVLLDASLENFINCQERGETPMSFEKAGPHKHLFFEASKTKVAIFFINHPFPNCADYSTVVQTISLNNRPISLQRT